MEDEELRILLLGAALSILAIPVSAQTLKRTIPRNQVTAIHGGIYFTGSPPLCESKPRTYRIIRNSKLGELKIRNITRAIKRVRDVDRANCVGNVVEMGNLFYNAGSNGGGEQITVKTQNSRGREINLIFRITVE